MKKSAVIAIVGLLALILFLQYLQKKTLAPSSVAPVKSGLPAGVPGGVPLPAWATGYAEPALPAGEIRQPDNNRVAPQPTAGFPAPLSAPGPGPLPTVSAEFAWRPFCSIGKSLNHLLADHGRLWGYNSGKTRKENDQIYDLLGKYFSCQAAAYRNTDICNFLPGSQAGESYSATYNYWCMQATTHLLFYAYASGRLVGEEYCDKFLQITRQPGMKVPPEFCRAASGGFERVYEIVPADQRAVFRGGLPTDRNDCGNTPHCEENYALYQALKAGNPAACPERYRSQCKAFFSKPGSSCDQMLEKLGKVYCQILSAGGRNPDGLEADRINQEVQTRVRELLGRRNPQGADHEKEKTGR